MIRIVENNDWVIYILLGVIVAYVFLFNLVHKEISIKDYLLKSYAEAQNNIISWLLVSFGFVTTISVLMSQFIPIVPRFFVENDVNGWIPNKMGFILVTLSVFYLIKTFIIYVFYIIIGENKKIFRLSFIAQKIYFTYSIINIIIIIAHYYFIEDKTWTYHIYLIIMSVFFITKNIIYFFNIDKPIPTQWYYKILYICTLQILPLLAIWKFIFL